MRAKEFIVEARIGSLQDDVARALPATYVIPALKNQDPYKQLRFGVAIAAAKSSKHRQDEQTSFEPQSAWGENEIVISYDPSAEEFIDDALKMVGLSPSDKKLISTLKSEEATDVVTKSPVPTKKKNKYGV
jgi:hypothetical protein